MVDSESGCDSSASLEHRASGSRLARIWAAIRSVSRRAGQAEARGIMSAFYFVALGAVALVMGRRRKSLLMSPDEPIAWRPLQARSPGDHAAKQY
jgi:hypothetical protein